MPSVVFRSETVAFVRVALAVIAPAARNPIAPSVVASVTKKTKRGIFNSLI